jgi:hypothetical protein
MSIWFELTAILPSGEAIKCPHCGTEIEINDAVNVFSENQTNSLTPMAKECGAYELIWRPGENGYKVAKDITEKLEHSLELLKGDPEKYRTSNPPNHWGSYGGLIAFLQNILAACREYPEAEISVSK